jgi:nicotinamidase-related amidase
VDVLLVIDMQEGLLHGAPKRDVVGVVERINRVAARVRDRGGAVVFVQHAGPPGDEFEPDRPGWRLLDALKVAPADRVVSKTVDDAFFATSLHAELKALRAGRLLVAGWATDLCVDGSIRSAVALGYKVVVVADGHTVSDRPHLDAEGVRANLLAPHPVSLVCAAEL